MLEEYSFDLRLDPEITKCQKKVLTLDGWAGGRVGASPSLMGTTVIAVAGSTVERFLASGGPGKTGFWSHLAPNLLNHLEPGFLCPRALVSGVMVKLYPLLMEEAPIFPVFS